MICMMFLMVVSIKAQDVEFRRPTKDEILEPYREAMKASQTMENHFLR